MKSISEQLPVHTITIAKKQWSPLIFNMAAILTKEVKDVHLEHTVQGILLLDWKLFLSYLCVRDRAPSPLYDRMGQTHVNGWSRVIASQNGGLTSYIFPLRLEVLQWSRHLFNYWKNKKTIIEKIPHFINLKFNLHWS